jgi:hypothetical protein
MPIFFFKVSDSRNEDGSWNSEWVDLVRFAITDFMVGCRLNGFKKGVVILIINSDAIKKHDTLEHEYINDPEKEIPRVLGSYKLGSSRDDIEEKIIDFIRVYEQKYGSTYDSLYFHITCTENIESIKKYGLIDIKNNPNQIPMKAVGDSERGGSKKKSKRRKTKRRKITKRKTRRCKS